MMKLYGHFLLTIAMAFIAAITHAQQPNILLIVSEDNGPELGCYGDRFARTPHLDRLADEGILFSRAYVPQAGCSQSRASFLTGLYPHQHGQIGLATWGFRMYTERTNAKSASQLKRCRLSDRHHWQAAHQSSIGVSV